MKVLIVANNCSTQMGGEAILPYHYFRLLHARGQDVYLLTHERNRLELSQIFPGLQNRITYLVDTPAQKVLWNLGLKIPKRIAEVTFSLWVFLIDSFRMKKTAAEMVKNLSIDIVHQPIPVSPKEPSAVHSVGCPVVIGPMNGGMEFPPGFSRDLNVLEQLVYRLGKSLGNLGNFIVPGKRKASLLLCANQRTAKALPSLLSRVPMEILVENAVDLDLWVPPVRGQMLSEPEIPEFIFIGRLVDWKGLDYLLRALAALHKTTPALLHIVGQGEERAPLERLAVDLDLQESVFFHGFLDQKRLPDLMQRCRALVLPSIYECGGAVVLEAMASGKAVIASDWGGPADYLDSQCGILVQPTTPDEFIRNLASAMKKLADNPDLAELMGKNGADKVKSSYNWQEKIDKILEFYQKTLLGT